MVLTRIWVLNIVISFELSGILGRTGTPIDKLVFINLQGYELVHLGWKSGKIFSLKNQDISKIILINLFLKP